MELRTIVPPGTATPSPGGGEGRKEEGGEGRERRRRGRGKGGGAEGRREEGGGWQYICTARAVGRGTTRCKHSSHRGAGTPKMVMLGLSCPLSLNSESTATRAEVGGTRNQSTHNRNLFTATTRVTYRGKMRVDT